MASKSDQIEVNSEKYSIPKLGMKSKDCESVAAEPNEKTEKLATLLQKKEKKATELIERMEKLGVNSARNCPYSIEQMKAALNPSGYHMKEEGKTVRISKEEVNNILNRQFSDTKSHKSLSVAFSRNKSEGRLGPTSTENAQRVAYQRYLSNLEAKANEEQKRILAGLKREHEAIERIKQQEKQLNDQRQLYRKIILDQITQKRVIKAQETQNKLASQDIAGNCGYPPIPEPSAAYVRAKALSTYKKQKDIWQQQIEEKYAKKKKEKDIDCANFSSLNTNEKAEEKQRLIELEKRRAEQAKWKDVWETEIELRKLRQNIENGNKPVEVKQFTLPLAESIPQLPSRVKKLRNSSSVSSLHSKPGVFITTEPEDDKLSRASRQSQRQTKEPPNGDYPWEKRERSREQYRNLHP